MSDFPKLVVAMANKYLRVHKAVKVLLVKQEQQTTRTQTIRTVLPNAVAETEFPLNTPSWWPI